MHNDISRKATVGALLAVFLFVPATVSATGLLIPTDRGLPPLAIKHHRVDIDVKDGVAVTKVEQVFVNHTSRPLEATFVFPAPTDAVIVDFKLMINGKMKRGEVLAKERANQIYTDIVRRMRDPGVLDWMSATLFKARIFPVPARGEQKVEISYSQVLPIIDGTYKLVYPLKTPGTAATTMEDFTLTTKVQHTTPLRTVYSPTHRIAVGKSGEHKAVIGFEGNQVKLDSDFILYFGVSKEDIGLSLLTHKVPGEPGYFMLMAAPKAVWNSSEIQGKAITFVLDTSGSMQGAKLKHAKKALEWCLDHLGSDDRFNIVRFSSDVEQYAEGMVVASRAEIGKGKAFVEGFEAAGGTAIDDALTAALAREVRGVESHLIVFITDGRPTVGETAIKKILERAGKQNAHRARVFAFGIGDDINTHLLDKLSEAHGGTTEYVKPNEDIATHIAALYQKVAYPVLTDVGLRINNVKTFAVLPNQMRDLFRGGQIIVTGRYRGDGDALVRVTGSMSGTARTFDFEGPFPARRTDNEFIKKVWAHRQVGFLLDQIRLNGETAGLRDEVVQLATRYGIVTPYTSFLVVEDNAVTSRDPRPLPVPRPRPSRRLWKGRSGGGGSLGAADKPAAAPAVMAEAKKAEEAEQLILDSASDSDGEGMRTQTGKKSVANSKVAKHYKDKKTATDEVAGVRNVAGRVFTFRGGRWVDRAFSGSLPTLRIAPYSEAWIKLAQLRPDLKQALSLGEQVTIVVGKIAVIVEVGGQKKLGEADIKKLKRR